SAARRRQQEWSLCSSAFACSPGDRQTKSKDGTVFQLANDTYGASVRLDNGFCNGQAHACARDAVPLIFATIEFVENEPHFLVVDFGPMVGDADERKVLFFFRADRDWLIRRGIQVRILDQMDEHFPCTRRVRVYSKSGILDLN